MSHGLNHMTLTSISVISLTNNLAHDRGLLQASGPMLVTGDKKPQRSSVLDSLASRLQPTEPPSSAPVLVCLFGVTVATWQVYLIDTAVLCFT